jgi:large subunit ribosomal protein L10
MPNDKNKELLKSLREKVAKAKAITFADYAGLKAADLTALRSKMREMGAEVSVAKNTLVKLALKEENVQVKEAEKDLEGPTAIIFAYNDAVAPIKALFDFIKKVELPKIRSAIFDGKYATAAQVETISKLPSREQLIAQVVGGFKSPLNGIVGALNGVQRKFVYSLAAIAEKKKS